NAQGAIVAQIELGLHLEAGFELERTAGLKVEVVEGRGRNRIEVFALEGGAQVGRHERIQQLFPDLGVEMLAHQAQRGLAGTEAGNARALLESLGDAGTFALHFTCWNLNFEIPQPRSRCAAWGSHQKRL